MALPTNSDYLQRQHAGRGLRASFTGGGATNGSDADNGVAVGGGRVFAPGTYWFFAPVRFLTTVEAVLKPTAITGAVTSRLIRLTSELEVKVATALAPAIAAATVSRAQISDLVGDEHVALELFVPAAGSATIGVAEWSAR